MELATLLQGRLQGLLTQGELEFEKALRGLADFSPAPKISASGPSKEFS